MKKKVKINLSKKTIIILVALFLLASFFIAKKILKDINEKKNLEIAFEHLKELENKDIAIIEKDFKENSKIKDKEFLKRDASSTDSEFFSNSVFMGDSITEGIGYYKAVNPSNVVGVKGQNVIKAKESVSKVAEKNPHEIFILYGMNDLQMFGTKEEFIKEYENLIKDIQDKIPDAKLYVESILNTSSKLNKKRLSNERIAEFNGAIKKMTEELKIEYLDITQTIAGKDELYEGDGIHPKPGYYSGLIKYIRDNIKS